MGQHTSLVRYLRQRKTLRVFVKGTWEVRTDSKAVSHPSLSYFSNMVGALVGLITLF